MADNDQQLTAKEEAFVYAYIGEAKFVASRAAVMAGYSEKNARHQGPAMLAKPHIAARVKAELEARAMPADAVLSELTDIAAADWREFVTVRTHPKTGEVLEVRMDMNAKVRSLELLAKAHGLLTDKLNVTGAITFADLHALAATEASTDDSRPGE